MVTVWPAAKSLLSAALEVMVTVVPDAVASVMGATRGTELSVV